MDKSMQTNLTLEDGHKIHDVTKIKIQERPNGSLKATFGKAPADEWGWESGTEVSRRVEEVNGRRRVIIEEK